MTAESDLEPHVEVELLVDEHGIPYSAAARKGPQEFYARAVRLAGQIRYKPFECWGTPTKVRLSDYVAVLPPELAPPDHVDSPEGKVGAVRITLEQSPCFGSCSSYKIELTGDGVVSYTGLANVTVEGRHQARISTTQMQRLVNLFRRADFFSLRDVYPLHAFDGPSTAVSIEIGGKVKRVLDQQSLWTGMPAVVADLERAILEASGARRWTIGDGETVRSLLAEGWDPDEDPRASARMFRRARWHGDDEVIEDLLQLGVSLKWRDNEFHEAVFQGAARRLDLTPLRKLLLAGAGKRTKRLKEALYDAILSGSLSGANMLIAAGADPRARTRRGSMLIAAVESGRPEMVARILSFSPRLDEPSENGETAWRIANRTDIPDYPSCQSTTREEIRRLLLKTGPQH